MKIKIKIFVAAMPLLLAAGCASNDKPIYFASASKVPTPPPDSIGVSKGLSKADEREIQMAVYSYLLDRNFWDDANYTAIFAQADDPVVAALMAKYPKHIPPIKESFHIDLRSSRSPLDQDTGKPAMILGADMGEPNEDGSVDVVGRWYADGAVQGFHTFSMKKIGDDWTIASVK